MPVFDDKDYEYGSTPESLELAKRFANRTTKQIATGDPQAFGNLSSADALSALENGTYRGLEGIDFGTAYGSPVAKLPNGMVLDVTAGTMLSAIKTREAKRREIVAKMLRANDRDAYREKNRGSFDALLSGLVEEGGLSEAAAQLYRNEFNGDNPAAVLTTLLGFDRTDMRAMKAAEETAKAARDEAHNAGVTRRYQVLTQQDRDAAGQGLSPTETGRMSMVSGGMGYLYEASNKSADWEQRTDAGEMAQYFAAPIVAGDPALAKAFSGLRERMAQNPDLTSADLAESPLFATLVGGISKQASRLAPMSPEYATQVAAELIGAGSVFIEGAQTTMQQRTGKARMTLTEAGFQAFPPDNVPNYDRDEDRDISEQDIEQHATNFLRHQLVGMGIPNASDMSSRQVQVALANMITAPERGPRGEQMQKAAMRILSIAGSRYGSENYSTLLAELEQFARPGAFVADPESFFGLDGSRDKNRDSSIPEVTQNESGPRRQTSVVEIQNKPQS